LLLNNDVELEKNAILEMSRWIEQPNIGIVGCRLHYPNGLLQHGGVGIHPVGPNWRVTWEHIEKMRRFHLFVGSKLRRLKLWCGAY